MAPPASATIQELFATARQLHQAGRLSEAERHYRQILAIEPRHPDSRHLLGVVIGQAGQLDLAVALIREAIGLNPNVAAYHANLGTMLQQQGRLDEATACFHRALALRPDLPDAHNNLGNALSQLGRLEQAEACFHRALALRPDYPEAHNNLGEVRRRQGRLDEAEASLLGALALRPTYPEAHRNLGHVRQQQGRPEEAITCFQIAIGFRPNDPDSHDNLANALLRLGRPEEAIACFRQVLALRPDSKEAHNSLGVALKEARRLDEAVASFQAALELGPHYPEAYYNLGNTLQQQGRLGEAEAYYRSAVGLRPDFPEAHNNLGNVLQQQGRPDEAVACCRAALALRPAWPEALYNLGNALLKLWRLDEAVASFRQALDLRPDFSRAHNNLGNALKEQGKLDEAIAQYEQALRIRPDDLLAYSSLLFAQNYRAHQPAEALRELARQFGVLATGRVSQAFARWHDVPPGQPLRVGLVSGDLGNHPVGYFIEGLLRAADPTCVTFLAFPTQPDEDDLTARIRPHIQAWEPIHALTDEAAAKLIHANGVQVLLDLSGHTANNRLPVFAWRPAPVQASWLGYFATTGLAEIDYVIGDPQVAPPKEASHFTETVWTLPETYLCFTPAAVAVGVSGLPAQADGHVTFGCFNNLTKFNDTVVALWARVLHAVPGSRLLLKAFQLQDAAVRDGISARFAAHGIGDGRLLSEPSSSRASYLHAYGVVDIALDPFPYPGGTTTCEALWMGVPVLTKQGNRFLSHAGETIMRNAGLPDWIAADDDDYVALAVRFAADLDRLAGLRAGLRDQVLASPLFDAARFARHFEAALWGMWRHRLGGK